MATVRSTGPTREMIAMAGALPPEFHGAGRAVVVPCPLCRRRICKWRRLANGLIDFERSHSKAATRVARGQAPEGAAQVFGEGQDFAVLVDRDHGNYAWNEDRLTLRCSSTSKRHASGPFEVTLSKERIRALYDRAARGDGVVRL